METPTKRGFLLTRGWIQAVILVFLFGFFVLGFLAYRTYTGEPPNNIARTWHVQLALFWVSTGFLAGGIFFFR